MTVYVDGEWESPFDGDVAAERDALRHEPYAPVDMDGGRVYARLREGLPVRIDRRCSSCGVERDICASATCIRREQP